MKQYILKNDTQENVSARVTVTPSDELDNLGHEGATVIEDGRLTTCLAPTAVTLPDPTGHRSQCFELKGEGRYAIEINGVIQPFAFSPADLMNCFNGEHESQIHFRKCVRPIISCDGANSQVSVFMSLPWQGESGGTINLYNDETNELISDIQGYYLNPPDYNMADRLSPDVTYITANPEGNSTQTDYDNYHVIQQLISYRNTTSNPVRLRFEILHSSENEFPKTIFTEETEFHHNPTLFLIEETQDRSVYGVCLAPVEEKPEISCAGATDKAELTDGTGSWDIELNGTLYVNPGDWGCGYLISRTPELVNEISIEGDGNATIFNLSTTNFQRVRLIPRNTTRWEIDEINQNPTLNVDENNEITVCLSPYVAPPKITYEYRIENTDLWINGYGPMVEHSEHQQKNIDGLNLLDGLVTISDQGFWTNKLTEVVIPDTVTYVGQNTFADNKITLVELGINVNHLGNYAFKNNLINTVWCKGLIPPPIESMSYPPFDNNPIASIRVPAEAVDTYKAAPYWSGFASIITAI